MRRICVEHELTLNTEANAVTASGYTQNGSSWVHTGGGTVDYVQSFPAGFNTGNYFFGLYNRAPVTPFENATDKAVVSTSVAGYLYWHWCRGGLVRAKQPSGKRWLDARV